MEYNIEELQQALIEKCATERILYAMVAINRETKEIILPRNIDEMLSNPDYYVCCCEKIGEEFRITEVQK